MAQDPKSELEKRLEGMTPTAQIKAIIEKIKKNSKALEELRKKLDLLADKIEDRTKV